MDDSSGATARMIDEIYEFSAPRFFDFIKGESEEETREAELWFETALSYAPSPSMVKIKAGNRSVHVESLCNFSEEDQIQKASEASDEAVPNPNGAEDKPQTVPDKVKEAAPNPNGSEDKPQTVLVADKVKEEEVKPSEANVENNQIVNESPNHKDKEQVEILCAQEKESVLTEKGRSNVTGDKEKAKSSVQVETEACTPKPLMNSQKKPLSDKKYQTAKKIASMIRNPSSVLKPKKGSAGTPNLALENQAIKRQKLDAGRSRQILNVKSHHLPHKSKLGLISGSSKLCSSTAKTSNKLERKVYVREPAAPFVSMAEMMKKFQSSTRDLSLPNSFPSNIKPTLKLTRAKEPAFETAQRVRSVEVKSTAELEEEMMAKIPKFKARPLNKKIFEAQTVPVLPRRAPKPPEFQEFHLETMTRANKNAETPSIASTEVSRQNNPWRPHLTEPKTPTLQTSLRARPSKVKSSVEIEEEELQKAPKFKARPLNKKIFESKGELGIFCNAKKQATIPQEFHFATNDRIPPAASVVDLFDKLSLKSESSHDPIPRNTIPNPFHLKTEERAVEKERKFVIEIIEKQFQEERARVPKANPYPYTTDYPVVPPKPEPKHCTKPEPFQLVSLVRHEEEMQREMEERLRKEKEEAEMRIFKAQPILRPSKVKSSVEIEEEELQKAPKFKARPLNKKIFESKGELGIFCNAKKQATIPQEFHFATNDRIPPAASVVDLFDKLSLKSESSHDPIPRNTIPNPFHLKTEERAVEKERKFVIEIIEKQFQEERARVPKANPYPYTTDYPVVPPKPEPKHCTKPEPFQLVSLVRHEEEMQREMEERLRKEKEEAEMRIFKAQPILKEDPIPAPEKVRKPLTQVQEFSLHVNHRAVERAEFDQKIKEKEMMYKRYREESEAARMIEEEKAVKQLRRTMVPHARPVPKFDNPFCPQKSSKETTKPRSPHLRVVQRKERRKIMSTLSTATSSPATSMRSSKETTKPRSPHLRVVQRKERRKIMSTLSTATSSPATSMR